MGFFRWLQKIGSTGSIARWTAKNIKRVKEREGIASDAKACTRLFEIRYSSMPPRGISESSAFKHVKDRKINTPRELAWAIWDIEIGSQLPIDVYREQSLACRSIIAEELERLGV